MNIALKMNNEIGTNAIRQMGLANSCDLMVGGIDNTRTTSDVRSYNWMVENSLWRLLGGNTKRRIVGCQITEWKIGWLSGVRTAWRLMRRRMAVLGGRWFPRTAYQH